MYNFLLIEKQYIYLLHLHQHFFTNNNEDGTSTMLGKVKVFVNDWWSLMSKYLCSNQLSNNDVNWDQMNTSLR